MKKTLVLTHEYYPFHGGVANYCYGLFSHLPEQNYIVATDMKLADGSYKLKVESNNQKTNLQLTRLAKDPLRRSDSEASDKSWRATDNLPPTYNLQLTTGLVRPRWLLGLWNIYRLIKREKIEIIFTPNIFPLGQIAYHLWKSKKIPYIISLHGLDIRLAVKKNKSLATKILNSAQQVIVNSQATAETIKDILPSEKVTVITPYLHTALAGLVIAERPMHDVINLLTVGRLTKRKGHDMVIQALNLLATSNLHYTIIGSGPEEKNLRDLIREWKLTNTITIKTKVTDEELQQYYQDADIFIMPTRNIGEDVEGYGIVYLEAASFHLPIIASQQTSASEMLIDQQSALLIDGTKPETVAEGIKKLAADQALRDHLGQGAATMVKQLPTWDDKAKILATFLT